MTNRNRWALYGVIFALLSIGCQSKEPAKMASVSEAIKLTEEFQRAVENYKSSSEIEARQEELSSRISDETFKELMFGPEVSAVKRDALASWYRGREARLGTDFAVRIIDGDDRKLGKLCLALVTSYVTGGGGFNEPLTPIVEAYGRYRGKFPKESGTFTGLLKHEAGPESRKILRDMIENGSDSERDVAKRALSLMEDKNASS